MNARERGFLLLTSHLGDYQRRPLTAAQYRVLTKRILEAQPQYDGDVTPEHLKSLGYEAAMAEHIVYLLSEEKRLDRYLWKGAQAGCKPITRVSPEYPLLLRKRMGQDSPGVLWAKGDASVLSELAVSLVGSRELREENRIFAQSVGKWASQRELVLVSGNARGADSAAQDSCLTSGGRVVSVIADSLAEKTARSHVLYLSLDGFDDAFTVKRALDRNPVIHALGQLTFVAQSELGKGGSWDGTMRNLKAGYCPVYCFRDGSDAAAEMAQMGVTPITIDQLEGDFPLPEQSMFSLF